MTVGAGCNITGTGRYLKVKEGISPSGGIAMKTRAGRGLRAAAAALFLSAAVAGGASAAVLVESDLKGWSGAIQREGGTVVDNNGELGWRATRGGSSKSLVEQLAVDLKTAGIKPRSGALDFIVTRGEEGSSESLFTLVDESQGRGRGIDADVKFRFILVWREGMLDPNKPQIYVENGRWRTWIKTNPRAKGDDGQWFSGVPFNVPRGQTFRMTITWNEVTGLEDIYLDGKKLAYDYDETAPGLSDALRESTTLLIGSEPWFDSVSSKMTSLIKDVRVLDIDTLAREERAAGVPIAAVSHNAFQAAGFSGKLVAGGELKVALEGEAGAVGTFDVAHLTDLDGKIPLDWRGWGVYLEDKTYYEPGEVNLRDVEGYQVYASKTIFDPAAPGMEPVTRLKVEEQSYTLEFLDRDSVYYVAVVAEMRDGTLRPVVAPIVNQALTETAPGSYAGSWKAGWNDRYPKAVVVGRLTKGAAAGSLVAEKFFTVDPSVTITVNPSPSELRADEKSESAVTVALTDANGNPVAGHKVKFVLATTSQYTGVVGGGAFADQVGGSVKEDRWGESDLFGKVSATYVAGFAAKTAVIVVRDMVSNDTGAGWIKTFIQSTAQLELLPVEEVGAAAEGYEITVTSSDEWLTADGRSQARITAKVTQNGEPVEGHKVGFDVSSGSGSVSVVKDTTGRDGEARAVYTAGKKIGKVLITATDFTVNISGGVMIELRSDAPAKLKIKIDPEKIPADGRSTADLLVQVSDINDNPNDNVAVEYRIAEGGGRMGEATTMTDRNGESENSYMAGGTPGRVSIEITVRSTVPTDEELATARGFALAVTDYKFY